MNTKRRRGEHRTPQKRALRIAAVLLLPVVLWGCDNLLEVTLPGSVTEEDLVPATAEMLALSAQGSLEHAWSRYTSYASLHSDEWNSQSGNRQRKQSGLRLIDPGFQFYITQTWAPLHAAIGEADEFAERLADFPPEVVPNRDELIATVKGYGAWPFIALAEGMCASPIHASEDVYGANQLFSMAEERFTEALQMASAAGLTEFESLARAGRARARLGKEDFEGAIADAELVPEGFEFRVTREDAGGRRINDVFNQMNGILTVDKAGSVVGNYWDLEWKGVPDPRIQVEHTGELSYDFTTEHHRLANKHTSRSWDMLLASWREAQMVIADAAAQSGDLARAREVLNGFHERAGIPSVTEEDTPNQSDVIRHVIQERSREFFAEGGYRLFDHNRWRGTEFEVPFLGEPGSFYPDGFDSKQERFGNTTCFPTPRNETTPEGGIETRVP